ncbi:MAG: tyrosine-type recombinase/integrase [Alteromonadaceae bacterium]|nr:tyrosine-type recombinase/integrase [Alteromonadaceae bacterium]
MFAKISSRKDNNILFIEFTYKGVRFRESMGLKDSRNNRNLLKLKLQKVNQAFVDDDFDIEEHFPDSKNLEKFISLGLSKGGLTTSSKYVNDTLDEVPTVRQFVKTWLNENEVGWKESHRVNQVSILKTHILPRFGNLQINNIKRELLLSFRAELANQINTKNERVLSNARINKIMSTLRHVLNEASTRFEFKTPYQNIKQLKNNPKDIFPFSLREVLSILQNVREDYRNYYTVRFFTGMRTGEIDGLKWKYVDFEKRLILVRETIVDGKHDDSAKTDSSIRDIQMSQQVYEALLRQHRATKKLSEYVFSTLNGKPLAHRNVTRRVWKPLLSELGLEYRKPYQTRHTAATLWLAAGEAPEWIAKQLGHAHTMMLFTVYSRFVPNLTRQDGSAFESLLSNHLKGE